MKINGNPTFYNINHTLMWVCLICLFSCDSDRIDPGTTVQDFYYFPLETGNYRLYEVIDIRYSASEGKDSSFYYLKAVIEDSYTNQTGDLTYVIRRYKRYYDTASWEREPTESWLAVRSPTNLVVYENSIPFVKLIFPVDNELTWDGNAFNDSDPEIYAYQNVDKPFELNETTWNNTVEVIHHDLISVIDRDTRSEVYARDIGLVRKESVVVDYVNDTTNPDFGNNIITSGREYKQTLIDHGKE